MPDDITKDRVYGFGVAMLALVGGIAYAVFMFWAARP